MVDVICEQPLNTFTEFVAHPSEEPRSVLTNPDNGLMETQVLEVYDGLSLNGERTFKVEVDSTSSLPVLVNLKEEKVTKTELMKRKFHKITTLFTGRPEVINNNIAGLQLKIVDIGNCC